MEKNGAFKPSPKVGDQVSWSADIFQFLIFWISLQEKTKEVSAISPPNANDAGRDKQAQSEGCEFRWSTRVFHFLIFLQDLVGDSSDYSDGVGRGLHRLKSTRERIGHARWTNFGWFGLNPIKFLFSHSLFSSFCSRGPRSTWDCSLEVCCTPFIALILLPIFQITIIKTTNMSR